jgi:hypothetical protein
MGGRTQDCNKSGEVVHADGKYLSPVQGLGSTDDRSVLLSSEAGTITPVSQVREVEFVMTGSQVRVLFAHQRDQIVSDKSYFGIFRLGTPKIRNDAYVPLADGVQRGPDRPFGSVRRKRAHSGVKTDNAR